MKKALFLIIPIILIVGMFLGCDINDADTIKGSGDEISIEKDFTDFTKVDLATAFAGTVARDDNFSVVIRIDDNLEQYLNVKADGDILKIYLDSDYRYKDATIEADITLPLLNGLSLSGASRVDISGFKSENDFDLNVSGASKVYGNILAGNMDIGLSGASKLTLEGSGDEIDIDVSGASHADMGDFMVAGDVDIDLSGASKLSLKGNGENLNAQVTGASDANLEDFIVQNVDIHLSGASDATINLTGTLNANLSGASKLRYYGNPVIGDIETSGSSSIKAAG